MSTGPINEDSTAYVQSSHTYHYVNGTSVTEYGTAASRRLIERRPGNIISRKGPDGWRPPTEWTRNSSQLTPQPPISFSRKPFYQPNPVDTESFEDGYGWPSGFAPIVDLPDGMVNRALIKALLQLKNQKVNLAQAFAEREQTVKLFVGAAEKISHLVSAYRSKNPKKLWAQIVGSEGKRGASLPASWLELQYGWKPLMSDVYGSASALNQAEQGGSPYRCSCVATQRYTGRRTGQKASYIDANLYIKTSIEDQVLVKVHLDYVLENPLVATLAQLGITNPVYLAWELLPYSFVVDWFSPVGDFLSSMDAALGWFFKGGTLSVVRRTTERGSGLHLPDPAFSGYYYSLQGYPSMLLNKQYALERSVYGSSPLPGFPGLKNPLSTGHIANAMSLLAQAFH